MCLYFCVFVSVCARTYIRYVGAIAYVFVCSYGINGLSSYSSPDQNNTCNNSDVRLTGGPYANQGRVELCLNRRWGTICDTNWNSVAAQVVCNQLGYINANGRRGQ